MRLGIAAGRSVVEAIADGGAGNGGEYLLIIDLVKMIEVFAPVYPASDGNTKKKIAQSDIFLFCGCLVP